MFKDFKEKFISYLTKIHKCPYCNGINVNHNYRTYNAPIWSIRGTICLQLKGKFYLYARSIHPDYKIIKQFFEVICSCKENRKFFKVNHFKR